MSLFKALLLNDYFNRPNSYNYLIIIIQMILKLFNFINI